MIRLEWRSALNGQEVEEVAALLEGAAQYDEEAGFSTARPDRSDPPEQHLLIRMGPRGERGSALLEKLPEATLVAYLGLWSHEAPELRAQLVVRPDVRSLGVATLAVETLLAEGGWPQGAGRDVQVWSHGSHPAAERMSQRFGAELAAAAAKTVCFLPEIEQPEPVASYRQEPSTFAEIVPGHSRGAAPAELALLTRVGVAHLDADDGGVVVAVASEGPAYLKVLRTPGQTRADLARLLLHGALDARGQGARLAVLYLDATDEDLVHAALATGFVHEHSDVRYDLAASSV